MPSPSALAVNTVEATHSRNFVLFTPPGMRTAIGGSGRVVGSESAETIRVRDLPGEIIFQSFGGGGDNVILFGDAAEWTVVRAGSNAKFSDGDTTVIVPITATRTGIFFDDGWRLLSFDGQAAAAKIGEQVISFETEAISTPDFGGYWGMDAWGADNPGRLFVSPGAPVTFGGVGSVIGTAGQEHVVVDRSLGTNLKFDASFGRGGDRVSIAGDADDFVAERDGSNVKISMHGVELTFPISPQGIELRFDGGDSRMLSLDTTASKIMLGDQIISADPVQLHALI